MEIKNICVVGGGRMGRQIALNAAIYGYGAAVYDVAPAVLEDVQKWAQEYLAGRVAKGRMTQEQVAKAVSKSRPAVANAVRLLELSEKILACLKKGEITAGHGKALLSVKDEKDREELLEIIVSKSLSVRQSEDMARRMNEEKPEKSEDEESKDRLWKIYVEHVEKRLTDALGRNVSVISGARKGRVYLDFYGNEDLENLINLLCSKEQK